MSIVGARALEDDLRKGSGPRIVLETFGDGRARRDEEAPEGAEETA